MRISLHPSLRLCSVSSFDSEKKIYNEMLPDGTLYDMKISYVSQSHQNFSNVNEREENNKHETGGKTFLSFVAKSRNVSTEMQLFATKYIKWNLSSSRVEKFQFSHVFHFFVLS